MDCPEYLMNQSREGEIICSEQIVIDDLCKAGKTAKAYPEIDNTPKSKESIKALDQLILNLLEPIRLHFGSLTITHGFTSQALINKVPAGIARNLDQHCAHEANSRGNRICSRDGASADIYVRGVSAGELADYIHHNLMFDRMYVYDRSAPLHISYSASRQEPVTILMLEIANQRKIPRVLRSSEVSNQLQRLK